MLLSFSLANSSTEIEEPHEEISNVAPNFLPLGNSEKKLISNGNKIVSAIEKYFHENGDYPSSLEILVPDYIDEIPKTGYTRTYLFSLKIEESIYDYSATFVKDDPKFSGFSIGVCYGMFDECIFLQERKFGNGQIIDHYLLLKAECNKIKKENQGKPEF